MAHPRRVFIDSGGAGCSHISRPGIRSFRRLGLYLPTGVAVSSIRIDEVIRARRSLKGALADLRDSYRQRPSAELMRMVQQLEAEIAIRRRPAKLREPA